jgi:hypothetical protein
VIDVGALGPAFEVLEILTAIVTPTIITSTIVVMNIPMTVRFGNSRKARRDFLGIFDLSSNSGRVVSYGICFSVEYAT